ncbi:unnamed protein product [Rotaria socialis]|uniref:TOD1/MUCI70 glycosyltransferase-like domain-containing protein n=1 Tax=Rotaria socialis TaxID=392032 RepID=A0A818NHT5_9BILA|nr:unnamed protein product [Rotaria socialis]CAF4667813.1 unnamed protein product [Rotaria socialis]
MVRSIKMYPYRRLLFLCALLLGSFITFRIHFSRLTSDVKQDAIREDNISLCFKWQTIDTQQLRASTCLPNHRIISSVWTHDGSGIMKYIQWIATRKLGNIRISRLNDECELIQENDFSVVSENDRFVQIYIMPLTANFDKKSLCSTTIVRIIKFGMLTVPRIYFKRRVLRATIAYQYLDNIRQNHNFTSSWNIPLSKSLQKANVVTKHLIHCINSTSNATSLIIDSEDMIFSNLIESEKMLTNFISVLGFNTSKQSVKDIIQYDSYQFMEDATWWDQSETVQHVLSSLVHSKSEISKNSKDFYHLHGNHSFAHYVADSRQCFNDGTFYQLQSETITNRISTDKPERCSLKPFDCAFGDQYSFSDREKLYQTYPKDDYFNSAPIKCGFAVQSIIDKVRKRYERNDKCEIIVFTCITNCYDPLPTITDAIPLGTCFVALLDTKSLNSLKVPFIVGGQSNNLRHPWDLIDLGNSSSLFRIAAKVTESLKMLGHRMFPLAKWFVWLDGKAYIINIKEVLSLAKTPIIGLHHHDFNRTSELEVNLTVSRVKLREAPNSVELNGSLQEIKLQEAEYKRDGFYSRSNAIGLPLFDIAIFIYRNNHPCSFRYLCGWHNEVNYFSYRGQLSVYYSAERLNLTSYLGFIPRRFYHTLGHTTTC